MFICELFSQPLIDFLFLILSVCCLHTYSSLKIAFTCSTDRLLYNNSRPWLDLVRWSFSICTFREVILVCFLYSERSASVRLRICYSCSLRDQSLGEHLFTMTAAMRVLREVLAEGVLVERALSTVTK